MQQVGNCPGPIKALESGAVVGPARIAAAHPRPSLETSHLRPPNPRVQRTRPCASLRGSPLTRHPLGVREIIFACAFGSLLYANGSLGEQPKKPAPYSLNGIVVRLYQPRSDTFSTDLSDASWNQVDSSLLATIEVKGEPGSFAKGRAVEITVAKDQKVVATQKTMVGVLDVRSGSFVVPVWIPGPLCENVVIRARLLGQPGGSEVKREVGFACGE